MAPTIKGPLGPSIRRRNTGIKRERVDQGVKRAATSADERSERGRVRKNRIKWTERIVTRHTRIEIERRRKKTMKKRKRSGRKGGQLTFDSKVFQRETRGVGHYRGSHTSFTSLPLLGRAHVNHSVLGCPRRAKLSGYVRRELKIYPL